MALNSENLTYWYFRLNGFFTIPNFVVHPDQGTDQRTDIDVFGVRLPHRAELLSNPMDDDSIFDFGNKIFVAIAEVKTDLITFNDTWLNRAERNVQRFLHAAGPFEADKVETVAAAIYDTGVYAIDPQYHVSLIGIGRRINNQLPAAVPQITWDHIADFVYARFTNYRGAKISHGQWDEAGKELWNMRETATSQVEFRRLIWAAIQQ